MRFVKPEVILISRTRVRDNQVREWLKIVGCDDETADKYAKRFSNITNPETRTLEVTETKTDAERLIELAGRRCYKSFQPGLNPNVTRIREDIAEYLKNILESGHGSVLEHYYATFAIENVSRVFTGEMNRHRAGVAISEASMRYIRYDDIPMVETPLIEITEADSRDLIVKKALTRKLFKEMFEKDEEGYKEFCKIWEEELSDTSSFKWKKHLTSLGRRFIGMGVATGGVWTFNIRALRHMCTMRASEAAEEEICVVAVKILELMMVEEPILFGDFGRNEKGFYEPKYRKV